MNNFNNILTNIENNNNDNNNNDNKINLNYLLNNEKDEIMEDYIKSNNNNNSNIKSLSNLLIIKILNYAIMESVEDDRQFTFMCTLSLVSKSWTIFILPKLDTERIFKNDDYLYTYLKVRESLKYLFKPNCKTSFKLCKDNQEMNAALSLLQLPSVRTGTFEMRNESYGISDGEDYNIYIDGESCGTLFSPDIKKIEEMSKPSSFGKADKTVYDESIRKGFHIEGDRINVPYLNYQINGLLINFMNQDLNKNKLYLSDYYKVDFELKLYKIHIYKEGGHFEDHIDTICAKNHIGTCIFPLGIDTYEGGEFVISENETFDETTKEYRIEATPSTDPNCYDFKWIAFYNDCIHKVKPVTKGTRIVLQYNVFIKDVDIFMDSYTPVKYSKNNQFLTLNLKDDKIVEMMDSNERNLKRVTIALDNIMNNNNVNTGLFLVHLYKAHINQDNLKGIDRVIWDHLKNHYGEDRIKIRTFIICENYESNRKVANIAMVTPKTIVQKSSLIQREDKDTLMFCGNKYSDIYSIYQRPVDQGNEGALIEDVGCFSAIIINGTSQIQQ